jgi:hypothetical protein
MEQGRMVKKIFENMVQQVAGNAYLPGCFLGLIFDP